MRSTFTKKQTALAVACALALGIFSATANAQVLKDVTEQALLTDSRGAAVMSPYGLCWHSQFGPTPAPNVQCGPQPVVAQYIAPPAPAPAPAAAPAPYVAPYVAPAPTVVAAAPLPVYEKVTLDADALFDFGKAALSPAGRDSLDKFVKGLKEISPTAITAIGHTDRIGSTKYNQSLSEERVAAVKAYLVGTGIQSSQVHASGKGEMQPVTKSGQCAGRTNAKLIACLQPDRRVEIEASGMKLQQ